MQPDDAGEEPGRPAVHRDADARPAEAEAGGLGGGDDVAGGEEGYATAGGVPVGHPEDGDLQAAQADDGRVESVDEIPDGRRALLEAFSSR